MNAAKKNQVMSQDEITLSMIENDADMEISEETIEVDQIETMPATNVLSLADYRKAMGYSK